MLDENGLITSPIWSGALDLPLVHHGYISFIGAGASIAAIEGMKIREHRKAAETHR